MLIDFGENNFFLTICFYLELEIGYPKWLCKARLRFLAERSSQSSLGICYTNFWLFFKISLSRQKMLTRNNFFQ